MGSTGSGSFSDYPKSKPIKPELENGGSSGTDKCGKAFSTSLEEVQRCTHFLEYGEVPPLQMQVSVGFNGSRLVVTNNEGVEIGYLPTKYNYIRFCLEENLNYGGIVTSSRNVPTPSVFVDITPL